MNHVVNQDKRRTDVQVLAEFLEKNPGVDVQGAFLAGMNYERRAAARLAFSVNDAMAHAIGRLIRMRAHDANRGKYE
jgi:dienelactone hydrolase